VDSQVEQEFSQVVEKSLEAIRSGGTTLEAILARYPQFSQQLRTEIEIAMWLTSRQNEFSPRPGFVAASRKRVVSRIQNETSTSGQHGKRASLGLFWPKRLMLQLSTALAIFVLLLLTTVGGVSASQSAVPGDNLYSIKRISEDIQYTLTFNQASRSRLSLVYSSRRLEEVEVLIARGQYEQVAQVLSDFEYKVNQSVLLLEEVSGSNGNKPDVELAGNIEDQLSRQTVRLEYLLGIAPESAHAGLMRALAVSQHGAETADEMHDQNRPTLVPGLIKTLPPAKTAASAVPSGKINKTQAVPAGKGPIKVDKTPGPPEEKEPANDGKPEPDTKVPKPSKEDNPSTPSENKPPNSGTGKPDKPNPSNEGKDTSP
jgi:hypothetical protein